MAKQFKFMRLIACILTVAILYTCVSAFCVQAAAYSGGSGTRKDPYLIKTADDLYNMRNNLSAHFKLASTIDMKGYKTDSKFFKKGFVPIGDDSTKPFTGSFTCPLSSDGLPMYAILNLNIYNAKGDLYGHDWYGQHWYNKNYPGYVDAVGKSEPYFYQTALFGNTENASISNIYVLNAKVYSSVVGMGNGVYINGSSEEYISYASFMDTQCTAVLVANAVNTNITHCAATGSVNGKSSRHGGLIGQCYGTSVSNSYVDVSIDNGGAWSVGVFAGNINDGSSIKNCFAAGKLYATMNGYGTYDFTHGTAGAFIGSTLGSTVSDCYTTATIEKGSDAISFTSNITNSTLNNCYSYGKVGAEVAQSNTTTSGTVQNCYLSNATNGVQFNFTSASPAEINKYFTSQDGWAKGSDYPVLSSTHIVKDVGIYVPGEDREGVESAPEQTVDEDTTEETDKPSNNTTAQNSEPTNSVIEETDKPSNSTEDETDETTDNTTDNAGDTDTDSNGSTTVEVISDDEDKLDTIQIVLISALSTMIIVICALSIIMAYTTLRNKPVAVNDEDDEIYLNGEGDE